jgi:hypothetical protein
MTYEKPRFVEIAMNAEIGSYQADFEPDRYGPSTAETAEPTGTNADD